MPISTLGSYLPTLQEFITHWTQADATAGGSGILLQGDYGVADLSADRDTLADALQQANEAALQVGLSAATRDRKKDLLRPRLTQFRAVVLGQRSDTIEARELPLVPSITLAESKFLQPFDKMAVLWQRLNAQAPLTLVGGYTLTEFQAELAALRTAYSTVTDDTTGAKIAREQRDVLLSPLKQRLKKYRQYVPGVFPAGHPLLATLPALTPPAGSTPDAVVLSGAWDSAKAAAVLTWSASQSARLDHYSVSACLGKSYRTTEEAVLGTVAAGVLTFTTDHGLAIDGAALSVKVYVVTRDGNERGSNAVKVVRG